MAYSTITKPADYFNTLLWSGTGASNSLTGVGFQPDWTWIKKRSNIADHRIFDSVRGATKALKSNATQAEGTETQALTSFDSDGFTLGTDDFTNGSGSTFVGWNWLAGGTALSNTDGSITSSVSASTTSGFSVVTYTGNNTAGATVGHGLGATPSVMIVKERSGVRDWIVYHTGLTSVDYYVYLNSTAAQAGPYTNFWNSTAPSSSVFTLGSGDAGTNGSGNTYIAYCFAEKKGYSKFGSYTGNGSTDGTFVYTGFKPAMVIWKNSSSVYNWVISDNKRNTSNDVDKYLLPNTSDAEGTLTLVDFLSNGFKIRTTNAALNNSGNTFIYMAFAENPLVANTGGGIPATAR